jgi:hypothetical protein
MASDSLLRVIGDLVKREGRIAKVEAKKVKDKLKAEKEEEPEEEEPEEEEPEDNAGKSEIPKKEPVTKAKSEPDDKEKDPEVDDSEGDTKPTGPDPALVAQIAAIIKQEIEDDKKEKKEKEIKLSGKKEKIDTTPTIEQTIRNKMNFKEAIQMAVTGTSMSEGYEEVVIGILQAENIDGPLGYEPFFEKGKLFVEKGSEKKAAKVLKRSSDINKIPKIVGESIEYMLESGYIKEKSDGNWCVYNEDNEIVQEFDTKTEAKKFLETELENLGNPVGESVETDGRKRGFKEAIRRLTYEKLSQLTKEGAAEFMAAASAAKKEGKKKFKFGGKEYPVTIKVDIPLAKVKESVTVTESNELQAIMALDDEGISAEINRKGQIVVTKKELKKAQSILKKSFKKGGEPNIIGEQEQRSAYNIVKGIRSKLNETVDVDAARELKMYIDNDQQLYKSQLVPIVKNIQRKMKSGKYDHRKAPKLWSYLVDNGAKKYVKEFGGTVKSVFPKDVRDSVAIEFANEYRSEIESQNGEMF